MGLDTSLSELPQGSSAVHDPCPVRPRKQVQDAVHQESSQVWADYLDGLKIKPRATMPIKDWKSALNQFCIMLEERLPSF